MHSTAMQDLLDGVHRLVGGANKLAQLSEECAREYRHEAAKMKAAEDSIRQAMRGRPY